MSNTSEALNAAPATRPRVLLVAGSWFLTFAVAFAIAAASFLLGVYVVSRDLAGMRQLIQTLQSEAQKSKQALIASTGANNALEAKLATVTADLEAIRPAKNTYVFVPNQSLIVGNGLLTLGLVGSPGNNGVVLNVNGTRRSVTSGDVIEVPVNSNRVCHVAVQSFDMFRAVLNAGCGPAP